jgi:NAD(P)H-dependent flavin oxidoreductase YrpB (nitropropane dioxygenase family)
MWPNDRFIKLCGIELPIIQAPMAGSAFSDMVVAVSQAGGLGSPQRTYRDALACLNGAAAVARARGKEGWNRRPIHTL